jgi:hypothetical protein
MERVVWGSLVIAVVACGGDDAGDSAGADSAADDATGNGDATEGGGATEGGDAADTTADEAGSGGASGDESLPECDASVPPTDDLCMRMCGLYESCDQAFPTCEDTACCLELCASARAAFWDATPECGERKDASFACVADLDCTELAEIADGVAANDPCAAEIENAVDCSCSVPA